MHIMHNGCLALGVGAFPWQGLTVDGCKEAFWSDGNILKLGYGDGDTILEIY